MKIILCIFPNNLKQQILSLRCYYEKVTIANCHVWNDLPHDIRSTRNLSCFKSRLKTHLFQKSFPP